MDIMNKNMNPLLFYNINTGEGGFESVYINVIFIYLSIIFIK